MVRMGCDVNVDLGNGVTPLHVAARYRQYHLSKLILEAGADLERVDDWGNPAATYVQAGSDEQVIIISRMLLDLAAGASGVLGSHFRPQLCHI